MKYLIPFFFASALLILPCVAAQLEWAFPEKSIDISVDIRGGAMVTMKPGSRLDYVRVFLASFPRKERGQLVKWMEIHPTPKSKNANIAFEWFDANVSFSIESRIERSLFFAAEKSCAFPFFDMDMDAYLAKTDLIDWDDREVSELAEDLANGRNDLFDVLSSFARWIKQNIEYSTKGRLAEESMSASWVLQNKKGACDEMTILFMALARAVNIPVRYVSGIAYSNIEEVKGWMAHAWAEAFFPESGWVPFDITYGQLGFVDASHVALQRSADPEISAVNYEIKGFDVELEPAELVIDAQLLDSKTELAKIAELELKPYSGEVDFRSFNGALLTIRNMVPAYVGFVVRLSTPEELELVSDKEKIVWLGPGEQKDVLWIFRLKQLEPGFVYSFPIKARTAFGAEASALFRAVSFGPLITLAELQALQETIEGERLKARKAIAIRCLPLDKKIYVGDSVNIECEVRNIGNVALEDIVLCLDADCDKISLGIADSAKLSYVLREDAAGWSDHVLECRELKTKVRISYYVHELPAIAVSIEAPSELSFFESAPIKVLLQRESESIPLNVRIGLAEQVFSFLQLDELKELQFELKGYKLDEGENVLRIFVIFEDELGRTYQKTEEVVVSLRPKNLVENALIKILKLARKVFIDFKQIIMNAKKGIEG